MNTAFPFFIRFTINIPYLFIDHYVSLEKEQPLALHQHFFIIKVRNKRINKTIKKIWTFLLHEEWQLKGNVTKKTRETFPLLLLHFVEIFTVFIECEKQNGTKLQQWLAGGGDRCRRGFAGLNLLLNIGQTFMTGGKSWFMAAASNHRCFKSCFESPLLHIVFFLFSYILSVCFLFLSVFVSASLSATIYWLCIF